MRDAGNPVGIAPGARTNALGVHALVWVAGWSEEECRHAVASTARVGSTQLHAAHTVRRDLS